MAADYTERAIQHGYFPDDRQRPPDERRAARTVM
jgi:hypothetical protein